MPKPIIGITMGDPAGIGPESIAGAWNDARVHDQVRPIVVGHPDIMRRACDLLPQTDGKRIVEISDPSTVCDADFDPGTIHVIRAASDDVIEIINCQASAIGGQAAYDCLIKATDLARQEMIDAIVTAPLNKSALHAAGKFYPGHTELLAELCGIDQVAMLLYLAPDDGFLKGRWGLGVAHVTLHMAMRDIFDHINVNNIVTTAQLLHDFFIRIQPESDNSPALPRIAVAALNCHGGEAGLFGDEEQNIIGPAVETCRQNGMEASGPIPIDTLMKRAAEGEFDGVVAMYHDQGHIPLKLVGMHSAVNITLGLPIVRTSVAHGTAFDIAWQGKMNPNSMVEAITVAAKLI